MTACIHWSDGAHCDAPDARAYLVGPRCTQHTPAALVGRQEPDTHAYPQPYPEARTTHIDYQAITETAIAKAEQRNQRKGKRT